jgi:hypothetical protein
MNFVKFTEYNDNEGETWNFWLQYEGNEKELKRLNDIVELNNAAGFDKQYSLDMTTFSEEEVDILVKHTDSGYMNYQNKIEGVLSVPEFNDDLFDYEDEIDDEVFEWCDNNFYKGKIAELFKEK